MRKPEPEDFGMTIQEYTQLVEERTQLRNSMSFLEGKSLFYGIIGFFVGAVISTVIGAAIASSMDLPLGNKSRDAFGICGCIGGAIVGRYLGRGKYKIILKQLSNPKYNKIDLYDEAIKKYELCQEEYWKSLRGVEFEKALADLYRNLGYSVQVTKGSYDEGIDLILDDKIIVQCKGHEKPVGVKISRELFGVLKHTGFESAILACPAGFTDGVKTFAYEKPIKLVALKEIIEMAETFGRKKSGQQETVEKKKSKQKETTWEEDMDNLFKSLKNPSPELVKMYEEFKKRQVSNKKIINDDSN